MADDQIGTQIVGAADVVFGIDGTPPAGASGNVDLVMVTFRVKILREPEMAGTCVNAIETHFEKATNSCCSGVMDRVQVIGCG